MPIFEEDREERRVRLAEDLRMMEAIARGANKKPKKPAPFSMDNLVRDEVGCRGNTKGLMIGLEIEMETDRDSRGLLDPMEHWRAEGDGSLQRNGIEWVLNQPADLDAIEVRIRRLIKIMEDGNRKVTDSPRAGVHIHLNMGDVSLRQLMTSLTAYYVLEKAIVEVCGDGRQGNLFCQRLCDSSEVKSRLMRVSANPGGLVSGPNDYRYSAMNLDSLRKFGSLEWRALRTPVDLTEIIRWVGLIAKFREVPFKDPVEVIESVSFEGARRFCKLVLGEFAEMITELPDLEDKIQDGVWAIQSVAFMNKWK